jgi:hypothetical protein
VFKKIQISLGLAIAITALSANPLQAEKSYLLGKQRAQSSRWHANYAHAEYGRPVALVVPPTANLQTNWSWGTSSTHVSRIDQQFGRDYPGSGPFGGKFRRTPRWPSNTNQFGVSYVRGPWYPTQR